MQKDDCEKIDWWKKKASDGEIAFFHHYAHDETSWAWNVRQYNSIE